MLALPVVGWAMLAAAGYPVVLYSSWHLPPILPQQESFFVALRQLHTVLAYLLFFSVMIQFAAAMVYGFIRRDGVLESMTAWRQR